MCLILILDLVCVVGAGVGFYNYGLDYSAYSTWMWVALGYSLLRLIISLCRLAFVDEASDAFFWFSEGFGSFDGFDVTDIDL